MAKFSGIVGFVQQYESSDAVWTDKVQERKYRGDVIKNARKWENGEYLNDNLNINNRFSIVADVYAFQNFFAIRYIQWMGVYWKVTNVEVQRPRLILTIGGVYNGPTGETQAVS